MKTRRKSRELALQALYAYELGSGDNPVMVLDIIAQENSASNEILEYARFLVTKTVAAKTSIDELLQKHASNWDLKRMAVIDRNILRMAVAELRFSKDVPYRVVIDEAVEIAKTFGTEDSGKFVNGVIDSIHKELPETSADERKDEQDNGTDA